jgi:hypothetical protein
LTLTKRASSGCATGIEKPRSFSMAGSEYTKFSQASEMALPSWPTRAVRPTRCT